MESQLLRLLVVFTIIFANLSLFVHIARAQKEPSSCMKLHSTEGVLETNCTEEEKTIRYFYDNTTKTCNPVFTCPIDNSTSTNTTAHTQLGHKSLVECKSQCGITCPNLTASNIVYTTCTTSKTECKAFYKCEQGYFFFGSRQRTCRNGVWSAEPICRKIVLYHKGQLLRRRQVINLNSDNPETIECKVLPSPPVGTTFRWTDLSKSTVPGHWNKDNTSYQLTISRNGTKGSWPLEFHCNATQLVNGVEKFLTTSVIFNATTEEPIQKPVALHLNAEYKATTQRVSGDCLCQGFPKPSVKWFINDTEFTSGFIIPDATLTSTHFTLSLLTIYNPTPEQHSGTYHCQCISGLHRVNSQTRKVEIPTITTGQTVSRRKRSITRVKKAIDIPPCDMMDAKKTSSQVTLIVGQVKRHLLSDNLLHVKVSKLTNQKTSLRNSPVIKVKLQKDDEEHHMERNTLYLMFLEKQSTNLYTLHSKLPYSKELLLAIQKHCQSS